MLTDAASIVIALAMEAVSTSEMSGNLYEPTWCKTPKGCNLD
jgi:hypothetical protein